MTVPALLHFVWLAHVYYVVIYQTDLCVSQILHMLDGTLTSPLGLLGSPEHTSAHPRGIQHTHTHTTQDQTSHTNSVAKTEFVMKLKVHTLDKYQMSAAKVTYAKHRTNLSACQYQRQWRRSRQCTFVKRIASLTALATETTRQRNVLGLDSHTLGVNGSQVRVFKERDKVGLS